MQPIAPVLFVLAALTVSWLVGRQVRDLLYIRRHGCPYCRSRMLKVIYAGLPGRLCPNETCSCLVGPASWIAELWFNGRMMEYEGSYFRALWHYLCG